jgi:hypothetical protein
MGDLFGALGLEAEVEVAPVPAALDYYARNRIDRPQSSPAAIVPSRNRPQPQSSPTAIRAVHGGGRGEHAADIALAVTEHADPDLTQRQEVTVPHQHRETDHHE